MNIFQTPGIISQAGGNGWRQAWARKRCGKYTLPRQLGVFGLGLLKDGNVGVGVFPKA